MNKSFQSGNRVRIIDSIRGFSLLGILLCNMLIFQYGMYGKDQLHFFGLSNWDLAMDQVLLIVAERSFMPIFMFLFGYSLFKLRDRLAQSGFTPWRSLVRRFSLLIVLGMLHGFYLWDGDILLPYGAIGFLLLLFVKRKAKTLVIWSAVLSALFVGSSLLAIASPNEEVGNKDAKIDAYIERSITVIGQGSYSDIIKFRAEDPTLLNKGIGSKILLGFVAMPIMLLPMFLLGIAAAKKGWFHNPHQERRRYWLMVGWLIPLGAGLKSVCVLLLHDKTWSAGLIEFGGQLLALGYIGAFALALSHLSSSSFFRIAFESVGRLSLTNYLMQSAICTTLFYGYGLGWFGKIGITYGILLAIVIYSFQAIASSFMLRYVQYGPLEYLLRIWTYFSFKGKPRLSKTVVSDKTVNL
ncbi:DUF418 domain-containing protein [Paenibacillus sp. NEAU-GSW1]|uniref:DUF418 domain-containing protein n=1 Tax=Paenibacillus sp. NEAU-GSW1 TaxID=2682486 RepID=UPI0012E28DC0|nr:DUF418 domain-containing protein [Paenibacillus sp. NEAU-GSW1]MUT68397.1 DUF418 domain-containing protein [Paenibacillus sp. NEAU-GSW1]